MMSSLEATSYPACGKVMGVEIVDDRLFHITRLGIGETDISDPANPTLVRFSWVVRKRPGRHVS